MGVEPSGRVGLAVDAAVWGLLSISFLPALVRLVTEWLSTSYLSYGLVFGPLSLWLAWSSRERLARRPRVRDWRGAAPLGVAFALFVGAYVIDSPFGLGLGAVACCAFALWSLHGLERLSVMGFPLLLATLSIPPPESVIAGVTSQLQLWITDAAITLLHAVALPVAREGNVLVLPEGKLFVAEACSGVASIFALTPAATLLAYFAQRTPGRRLALVVLALPIALFWNLVRVIASVLGALEYGMAFAHGPIHDSSGIITFSLGCLTLLGVGRLLETGGARRGRA